MNLVTTAPINEILIIKGAIFSVLSIKTEEIRSIP
jgi:hypothetical protein